MNTFMNSLILLRTESSNFRYSFFQRYLANFQLFSKLFRRKSEGEPISEYFCGCLCSRRLNVHLQRISQTATIRPRIANHARPSNPSNFTPAFNLLSSQPQRIKIHFLAERFSAPNPTDSAHLHYFYHFQTSCQRVTHQRGRIWVARVVRLISHSPYRPISHSVNYYQSSCRLHL